MNKISEDGCEIYNLPKGTKIIKERGTVQISKSDLELVLLTTGLIAIQSDLNTFLSIDQIARVQNAFKIMKMYQGTELEFAEESLYVMNAFKEIIKGR